MVRGEKKRSTLSEVARLSIASNTHKSMNNTIHTTDDDVIPAFDDNMQGDMYSAMDMNMDINVDYNYQDNYQDNYMQDNYMQDGGVVSALDTADAMDTTNQEGATSKRTSARLSMSHPLAKVMGVEEGVVNGETDEYATLNASKPTKKKKAPRKPVKKTNKKNNGVINQVTELTNAEIKEYLTNSAPILRKSSRSRMKEALLSRGGVAIGATPSDRAGTDEMKQDIIDFQELNLQYRVDAYKQDVEFSGMSTEDRLTSANTRGI